MPRQLRRSRRKRADIQDEFVNASNTKTAYKGYRDRGNTIIGDVVADRRQKAKEDPSWKCPEGIDTDLLANALKGPPNKHSVYALGLYMTQKCVVENLGKSTAEGIHGAFANYLIIGLVAVGNIVGRICMMKRLRPSEETRLAHPKLRAS